MNTQLPNCIPATLHCTPIEPCPTINPPCPGQQQAGAGTAATVCTQQGCQGTAATVCTQQHCPPQPAQAQGTHTYVFQTNCPPATVCAQPSTLCPPTIVCPQPQAGAGHTAATVCTQYGCHIYATPTATYYPGCGPQAAQPGPTPTATYYPYCHVPAAQAQTQLPQCQPNTTLCIQTVNFCPPQPAGFGCYPYTILPPTVGPHCGQGF